MKHTMLTDKTLTRFEVEYITSNYTAEEAEKIEFAAYVANMNECAHTEWTESDIFADFLRVLAIDGITPTKKPAKTAMKKLYEIWAEFPDGVEAKIESWKSLKRANSAVDAMNHANQCDLAEGYGFPHGVPVYSIRVSQ